jgi:hypothetical protein
MKVVTKRASPKAKCGWCGRRFKPKAIGRRPLYCCVSCRQRAYEKRRWAPYTASDALARDLLPPAARQAMVEDIRREYMLELVKNGTVPLVDTAQIDGVLDKVPAPERMRLLGKIEGECRKRGDEGALATIARWRLSQQQPSTPLPRRTRLAANRPDRAP